MPNDYIFYTLLTISVITILLRATPIFLTRNLKDNALLVFIAKKMPLGVMCLLIIYTLKGENYLVKPFGLPILICCALSIGLYLRYKSAILAIFSSLFVYLIMINYEFLLYYL